MTGLTIRYGLPQGLKGTLVPDPKPDEKGFKQPGYARSRYNLITSARLKEFQGCIKKEMEGKKFTDRGEVRKALTEAAKKCAE